MTQQNWKKFKNGKEARDYYISKEAQEITDKIIAETEEEKHAWEMSFLDSLPANKKKE